MEPKPNLNQLGFSSFISVYKTFQIVPGIDSTTFRENGAQICLAGKLEVQ